MLYETTKKQAIDSLLTGAYVCIRAVRGTGSARCVFEITDPNELKSLDGRKYQFLGWTKEYYSICKNVGLI